MSDIAKEFREELIRQGRSKNTIESYLYGLRDFENFLQQATGESFDPSKIIALDIREYQSHLISVEKKSPATANSRLSALSNLL